MAEIVPPPHSQSRRTKQNKETGGKSPTTLREGVRFLPFLSTLLTKQFGLLK